MALGLIRLAGITSLVVNTSASHQDLMRAGRLMDNGRYAVDLLHEESRHAGYFGRFTELDDPAGADPCGTDISDLEAGMPYAVQGYSDVTGNPTLSCLGDDQHKDDTDILVVRRASTTPTPVDELETGLPYIQSHSREMRLFAASSDQSTNEANFDLVERDGTTRSPIRRLRVDIYFVSPCKENSCTGVADPVPTLKRLELWTDGAAPAFRPDPVPLVEGVENLQVDYGIDRNDDGAPDDSSSGAGDAFEQIPSSADEWGNVVALRINVLMRSIEQSNGYTDDKRYVLGEHGAVTGFDDAYKRHVFVSSARVVNRSSRRES
jgi:type IV pilus assembly protein PilW